MGFAPSALSSSSPKLTEDGGQDRLHASLKQGDHQTVGLPTQDVGRFKYTGVRIVSASLMEEPLLHEHGIQLSEHPVRFFGALLIEVARRFLPPAQPLDLPALACTHPHFSESRRQSTLVSKIVQCTRYHEFSDGWRP